MQDWQDPKLGVPNKLPYLLVPWHGKLSRAGRAQICQPAGSLGDGTRHTWLPHSRTAGVRHYVSQNPACEARRQGALLQGLLSRLSLCWLRAGALAWGLRPACWAVPQPMSLSGWQEHEGGLVSWLLWAAAVAQRLDST